MGWLVSVKHAAGPVENTLFVTEYDATRAVYIILQDGIHRDRIRVYKTELIRWTAEEEVLITGVTFL